MLMLTVILPAYNEEEMVACAADAISQILTREDIPYEILFVDDGSTDGTWAGIMNLSNE
ncbi:MAG: glycosyltransferase, partial [Lachnospiraceae bacterium]|nr:glycosyltransferase [Lachnospiraceae bacterium]